VASAVTVTVSADALAVDAMLDMRAERSRPW
jgi:hypothetical protein